MDCLQIMQHNNFIIFDIGQILQNRTMNTTQDRDSLRETNQHLLNEM